MRLVYDTESDGFVEEAAVIWCIVTKDIDTNEIYKFPPDRIKEGIELLESANELICHNQIAHDLRLIKKLYPSFKPKGLILDTLILSQLLNPDRKGGHSLAQYGEELGIPKVENEDWSKFTPHMLHRCEVDVGINHKVYDKLMTEAYEGVQGLEYHKIFI